MRCFTVPREDCRFWGEGEVLPDACPGAAEADRGDREKMSGDDWCALGVFWIEQDGAEEKAVSCFPPGRPAGQRLGACNLGLCLEQGTGVEADPRQAVWLYQQAAEMGSLPALCNLAVCYEEGIGTPSDPHQAGGAVPPGGRVRLLPGPSACWPGAVTGDRDGPAGPGPGGGVAAHGGPFRGTRSARPRWPSTTSSATGWNRTRSCRCAGTAGRRRAASRRQNAVWAG